MLEGALGALVTLLALLGVAVLLVRLVRAVLRVLVAAAELTRARGLAEVSARRGDLTGLQEQRAAAARLRRLRRRDLLLAVLWLAWLAVPPALELTPGAYAVAAPLWLLKRAAPAGDRGQAEGESA